MRLNLNLSWIGQAYLLLMLHSWSYCDLDPGRLCRFVSATQYDDWSLGNTRYLHVGKVSLMFYDWLRDGNNQLLGMRVCRFADWEELCKSLAHLDGVVVAGDQIGVEIYLSEERAIEPALSCDQAFMYNELFRSRDGECVLAFGCECLGESDWKRLHDLDVEWVQFQVEVGDPLERTLSGVKAKVLDAVFTSSMKVDRWSGRVVKWINRTK